MQRESKDGWYVDETQMREVQRRSGQAERNESLDLPF